MAGAPDLPQVAAVQLVWLVTFEGDRVLRWTSADVVVEVAGAPVACRWGLAVDDQVESLDDRPTGATVAFPWPVDLDLADLWRHLQGATAELALVAVDAAGVCQWEERLVCAGGPVRDVEVDVDARVVSVQLDDLERLDRGDLCPPATVVSRTTWPLAKEEVWGAKIPWVYGAPGSFAFETVTDADEIWFFDYSQPEWWLDPQWKVGNEQRTTGATPAVPVDLEIMELDPYGDGSLLIEVPYLPRYLAVSSGLVEAATVKLWLKTDTAGWTTYDADVIEAFDGRGERVSLAVLEDAPTSVRAAGEWWVGWSDGGGYRAASPAVAQGALGALIVEVLRRSTATIDWPSVLRAAAYLDRYRIGGYVDESISPVQWVTDRARPFGAVPRWSSAGFGLVLRHGDADPVCALTVGADVIRSGPVRMIAAEADAVVVTWAANRGSIRRQMRTVARRRVGEVARSEELTAAECWDETTAVGVAVVALLDHGQRTEMQVQADALAWWWLRAGDVVTVADADLGWSDAWRIVQARHTDGPWRTLLLRRVEAAPVIVSTTDDTNAEVSGR